jgi:hypothetical protein
MIPRALNSIQQNGRFWDWHRTTFSTGRELVAYVAETSFTMGSVIVSSTSPKFGGFGCRSQRSIRRGGEAEPFNYTGREILGKDVCLL